MSDNTLPDVDGLIKRVKSLQSEYDSLGYDDNAILEEAVTALAALQSQLAHLEEVMVLRDAAISTAAIGYWKRGDSIHSEYLTPGLKDVADLYEKYAQQAERINELTAKLAEAAKLIDHLGGSSKFIREVMR